MIHSYTSTESWTHTYNKFRPSIYFSDLITTAVQCCEFCVGVVGAQLFFTGFKVEIYWEMVEI